MRALLLTLSLLFVTGIGAVADDEYPVAVKSLPAALTNKVEECFPGSEIISAVVDEDDDRRELNLRVEHQGLLLRVEARPDGRIREIDLDRRYRGLAALLGREASLEPLAAAQLPGSVTQKLADFFRGSKVLSAAEGINDEERFYRVRLRHCDLPLRVDITRSGRILDIDTMK
jgi:hypothetical protein